ncbi:hypothetical protein C7S18_02170 [Ahniella affigens]|uniref:Plasmid pRiA4b Orf3-like domain-containing protein n=1 Tax=Ahniella affigens TaxID=2021234 RepID=A0A2P1PML6_9GAMM|nr:plasmid pRiA4b ORF-3 family protein [Ahniella affigens]AVP96069.1 hypothetical protein C7S18_02170 [Ahniella affigens]
MATKPAPTRYQLTITLRGTEPKIWRTFVAPFDITLSKLHLVIQIVMGWQDDHLHEFSTAKQRFCRPLDESADAGAINEARVKLDKILNEAHRTLRYTYDFGDNWEHDIKLDKILPADPAFDRPQFLKGARACPPEDCGGVYRYAHLVTILANPKHPEHEGILDWLGDNFDPEHLDGTVIEQELSEAFQKRDKAPKRAKQPKA